MTKDDQKTKHKLDRIPVDYRIQISEGKGTETLFDTKALAY
jgi:hypothetical protein